jgi:hypothetical protein
VDSRLKRWQRPLIVLATVAITVLIVFPLTFGLNVEAPTERFPGNPFVLEVRISNENVTPFTNVEFSCQAADIALASGAQVNDAKVLNQAKIRRFPARRAVRERCETAYLIDAPLKSLEFQVVLKYRVYPWPVDRTVEHRFAAKIDSSGHVTGWTRK